MKKERFVTKILGSLCDKKISFSPHLASNRRFISSKKFKAKDEEFINLHKEIAQKVDEIILANEREQLGIEIEFPPADNVNLNPEKTI